MFNPYSANGGSVMGIAGNDFALIATDTRLSEEGYYMIYSRKSPHVYKMGPNILLGCVGFHGDVLTLTKLLENRVKTYKYDHGKDISTKALAGLLSVTLYNKRFFPFYVGNILVGLDEEGHGALYSYDPVGSYEREGYRAAGTSSAILQPFLDNRVGGKNMTSELPHLDKDSAVKLAYDIFVSASERDINCGDGVIIHVVSEDGVKQYEYSLRKD